MQDAHQKWSLGCAAFCISPEDHAGGRAALVPARPGPETVLPTVHVGLNLCTQECSLTAFILLISMERVSSPR